MGKDRRKKDVNRKQATSDTVGSEPKTQREPRNRASHDRREREGARNVENSVKDKVVENLPPPQPLPKEELPDTKELFANLKRETDDIKALSAKKTPSRQIFSSWTSYNKQLPDPTQDVEMQGADFTHLLHAPMSVGGHFQFKSEKTWDTNVAALSGELFSLNADLLAAGLATIPLYEKMNVPISLFTTSEIEDMNYHAKQSQTRYDSTKKNMAGQYNKKRSIMRIQEILSLKEASPVASEQESADKNSEALSFDIEGPQVQDEVPEAEVPKENPASVDPVKESPVISSHDDSKASAVETKSPAGLPRKEVTPVREVPATVNGSNPYKQNSVGTKFAADLPKEDSTTVASVKEVRDVVNKPNRKSTASKKSAVNKIPAKQTEVDSNLNPTARPFTGAEVTPSVAKSEVEHVQISAGNIKTESKIDPRAGTTSKTEAVSSSEEVEKAPQAEGSEEQDLQEPAAPLGQRSGRQKPKGQAAAVQEVKVKGKKPAKVDDDLDFLLGLKKPVRATHTPIAQSVQVTKPTIEDDEASSPQISLVGAQKQTEDLEDWLDSMLDD
ncbi:muscle M-line assembly protein unc-89 isoform X2 [Periplaneta americana]